MTTKNEQTQHVAGQAGPERPQLDEGNSLHIAGEHEADFGKYANEISVRHQKATGVSGSDVPGAVSSVGRAGASHASGREFETLTAHHFPSYRRFASIWDQGFADYFWKRAHVGKPDECWLWKAPPNADGYGQIKVGNRTWIASRLALTLALGREMPSGALACHHCDTRLCCNPSHIYVGSKASNNADMRNRGRAKSATGARNHFAILYPAQVAEIRRLIAEGRTNTAIADLYEVHHSTISKIRTGNSWA